jgi:hypothetical protein
MDDNDEEEEEDDDDDEVAELDRRGRYRQAFHVALAHDTQGYRVTTESSSNKRRDGGMERTPQELTALSWAAFCTNILPEEDATFRIQALDCGSLFDRLKLASHMLREKKNLLKQQMDKAGIKFRGEEFDEDL